MIDSDMFLIYAALYRLAVLAVGALSIWLGFRLFNNNAHSRGKSADSAGSASAEGGGFKLRLTNILPGTYFALFGTAIISVMLWKGEPPQLNEKKIIKLPKNDSGKEAILTQERLMRESDCQINLDGIAYELEKLNRPNLTFAEAADPLSKVACFYWQKNRIGEAVATARLASYGSDEKKALIENLLKVIANGNGPEAEAAREELQQRSEPHEKQP